VWLSKTQAAFEELRFLGCGTVWVLLEPTLRKKLVCCLLAGTSLSWLVSANVVPDPRIISTLKKEEKH
jgi:hypothetical protein